MSMSQRKYDALKRSILDDPAASFWLKQQLELLHDRDIVDAVNDAWLLATLLEMRMREQFGIHGHVIPFERQARTPRESSRPEKNGGQSIQHPGDVD
jgi:hypothetical protein